MPKITIALFFVLPLFAQSQRSDYCFATEDDARNKLKAINDYCSKTYGTGAGFEGRINVSSGQYCASAVCKGCSGLKVTDILDAYRKQCCIMGMEYSFNSSILCSESSFNGGGWGFTEPRVFEIYFDPSVMCRSSGLAFDKQQCKFVEKSSSSVFDGKSSSSIDDDDGSSSSDDGGSSSSSEAEDDEPDDDNDFGLCFPSLGDALVSNLLRRSECVASGGNISDMEVVLHPEDFLWCLAGSCDIPSSSSNSDSEDGISSASSVRQNCNTTPIAVNEGYSVTLSCYPLSIVSIDFASYGTPIGSCGNFAYNPGCHYENTIPTVSDICLGKTSCTFVESNDFFKRICEGVPKRFVAEYTCGYLSSSSGVSSSGNNSSSSAVPSSSSVSSSSSSDSPSSSSSGDVSSSSIKSSSSNMDIYEFCLNNPFNVNCLGGTSSSSKSAVASSSSQETPAKHNERGPNAVYTADDIFNSGLDNMEPGKCYSLNPDRGTQYGWINNNARDSWWWVERPCDGSTTVEPVTPSGCRHNNRGANAVYTIDDCFSGGLDNMEPGKCYSLNPDRGTQYGWINNDARDTWWWREVSCGVITFPKKYISESNSDYMQHDEIKLFYDAAGRKTTLSPEIRRFLFSPKKAFDKEQKSK